MGAVGADPFLLVVKIDPDVPPPPPPLDGVALTGSVEVLPFFDLPSAAMVLFFGVSMNFYDPCSGITYYGTLLLKYVILEF